MNKRCFNVLAIVVGLMAAWVISGCSHAPARITTSTNSSITIPVAEEYPQMYTREMAEKRDSAEQIYDVTFLGCYDDLEGYYLFWVWNNKTEECVAHMVWEGGMETMSCEIAYEMYRAACKDVGNCL